MFGLSPEKIIVIVLIAAVIIGPTRMPEYAAKLAKLVQGIKRAASSARERVAEEMGPEFDDVDWKKLDPRQYDPRRIVRTALLDGELMPTIVPPRVAMANDPLLKPSEMESASRHEELADRDLFGAAKPHPGVHRVE